MNQDNDIYNSEEYKARIERARGSLSSFLSSTEAISTAAESIAYWQMRAVVAEQMLYDNDLIDLRRNSNRDAI